MERIPNFGGKKSDRHRVSGKETNHAEYKLKKVLGPVPERQENSIPGINVPYSRDNFIPRITSVPERRNSAIQGINLG